MGAASSSDQGSSPAQQEEESLAASTGSLAALRAAFARLSPTAPLSSLHEALSLAAVDPDLTSESLPIPPHFAPLLLAVGPSLAALLFAPSKTGPDWLAFLRGYNKCCARMPASSALTLLYRLYSAASQRAGVETGLEFDPDDDGDAKSGGWLSSLDILLLLWMCYALQRFSRAGRGRFVLPDVRHLVLSALVSCGEVADDEGVWGYDILGSDKRVSAQKVSMWAVATVPGLVHCLSEYVSERIRAYGASFENKISSVPSIGDSSSDGHVYLLTCGSAWALSLTLRNTSSEELSSVCFPGEGMETLDNLLYRSSVHGKGLSRFWSNIEGYDGSLLVLLSANVANVCEEDSNAGKWVIGMLTERRIENRDTFFGNSGHLYAISPVFRVFPPSGKDKNFVYCHLHPAIKVYEPHPKPVGLAFGGSIGNERVFIDEDFARVTIRHHAVDKTYQHGSLIPNQGFLPVEASVLEVEVWGFSGKAAKEHQNAYKERETLFSEQRRKVDLKTFGSWEDSPEKIMMDMVSDPNRVRREDR